MWRRSAAPLLAVLALLAVGAWFVLRDTDGPPLGVEPARDGASEPDARAPSDDPPVPGEARVQVRLAVRARLLESRADAVVPCRLVERGVPVPAIAEVVAGPGCPTDRDHEGRHLVRFVLEDGSALWRVVGLGPTPCDVERFAGTSCEGIVVDARGEPVAGARVWSGSTGADGAPIVVPTDAEGRFVATGIPATPGVPLMVRADGFASHWLEIDLSASDRRRVLLQLADAAAVQVGLRSRVAHPEQGSIRVVPDETGNLELRHYPFFQAAVDPSAGRLDESGSARFDDLPLGSRVAFTVDHPDLLRVAPSGSVELRDESVRASVSAPLLGVVSGRVVDREGAPVRDAFAFVVEPRPGVDREGWLLPLPRRTRVPVDAAGTFRVGVPPGVRTALGIDAPGRVPIAIDAAAGEGVGAVTLVPPLDGAVPGPPSLRIGLPGLARERRAELRGPGELRWIDEDTLLVVLDGPRLVDVEVRVQSDKGELAREWRAMPIRGETPLAIEP